MPENQQTVDQKVIDDLTPPEGSDAKGSSGGDSAEDGDGKNPPQPSTNAPSGGVSFPYTFEHGNSTITVSSPEELHEFVGKGVAFGKKTQELASERKLAEATRAYHKDPSPGTAREYYKAVGYTDEQVDQWIEGLSSQMGWNKDSNTGAGGQDNTNMQQSQTSNAAGGADESIQEVLDRVERLEAENKRLRAAYNDSENVRIDREMADALESSQNLGKLLGSLPTEDASNWRKVLQEEGEIILQQKLQEEDYSPSNAPMIARSVASALEKKYERLGMFRPGFLGAAGPAQSLPEPPTVEQHPDLSSSKTTLADLRAQISREADFAYKREAAERRG